MAAKFLNERLVTTRRFGPNEDGEPPAETPQASAPAQEPEPQLESLLRKEAAETQKAVQYESLVELLRHQQELVTRLRDTVTDLEDERKTLTDHLEVFHQLQASLSKPGPQRDADPAAPSVKELRQLVYTAHMELLKFEKERSESTAGNSHELLSLTFGQLSRIGLALTWPILLGALAAAAIIAMVIYHVFAS